MIEQQTVSSFIDESDWTPWLIKNFSLVDFLVNFSSFDVAPYYACIVELDSLAILSLGKNCIEGLRQLAGYSTDLVGNPVLRSKRSVAYEIVSSVSGNTTSDNGTAADDVYNPVPTDPGCESSYI